MANTEKEYFFGDVTGPFTIDQIKAEIAKPDFEPGIRVFQGREMKYSAQVAFEKAPRKPRGPNKPKDGKAKK